MSIERPTVAVLLGTRPEAIKLAPVILELRRRNVPTVVVSTGQHARMVDQVLDPFGIRPDRDLRLGREGQSLDYVLSASIVGVGRFLVEECPAVVVVQGDTTSTLGTALAAFHAGTGIAHVEAGLRSHHARLPFPEEMNRQVTSRLTRWHFAPTQQAADNLRREGITEHVHVTGNTVVDALRMILATEPPLPADLEAFVNAGPYILATAHRRESWLGEIEGVARALRVVLDRQPLHRLVFATHPNPVAREPIERVFDGEPRARLVQAIDYPAFLRLLSGAALAVTDSGGVQEEGPTLGVPVLVTRLVTERHEGVRAGSVRLVGTSEMAIASAVIELITDANARRSMTAASRELYGDGQAARRIVEVLAAEVG
jgi:UDP-N-acetylglucosamine 2-epimerase (non-hydrolysing)